VTPEMALRSKKPSVGPPMCGCGCRSTMTWRRSAGGKTRLP
jgi:hypothetical protein